LLGPSLVEELGELLGEELGELLGAVLEDDLWETSCEHCLVLSWGRYLEMLSGRCSRHCWRRYWESCWG